MNNIKILFLLKTILFCNLIIAQESISISVSAKDTFIEIVNPNNVSIYKKEILRFGPNGLRSLRLGFDKAIKWATINETEQLDFQKEIARIKTVDKRDYDLVGYYNSNIAFDIILDFNGYSDGTFIFEVIRPRQIGDDVILFSIESISDLDNIKALLNGKVIDNKINRLFN